MENRLNITGTWNEAKEKLKEANIDLTDEDLQYEEGEDAAFIQRIAKKMKRSEADTKGWIESVVFTKGKAS